jgi:thymidylate synthase
LNLQGEYKRGYGEQLRDFDGYFDQVALLAHELKTNPYSRRLVMTVWNPADMARIGLCNDGNKATPACCHGTVVQLHAEAGVLHMSHFQRSADVLLGIPHNFVQYWALLQWFAHGAGLKVGTLHYTVGDLHLYTEESHLDAANAIADSAWTEGALFGAPPQLVYAPPEGRTEFLAEDFRLEGEVAAPVTTVRPKLL